MQEILKQLIELQKIDSKIASIEGVIKNTPTQISAIQEKHKKAMTGYDSIKIALDENKKKYLGLEASLNEKKNNLLNSQTKLSSVQNTKEYESVIRELDILKKTIAEDETQLKEMMNLDFKYESELSSIIELKENLEKELEKVSSSKADEDKEMHDELARLIQEREKYSSNIKKSTLMKYERFRAHRHNIVIASVKDEVCNGCYMHIPPQLYVEVKKDLEIHTCPHCQRILYYIPPKPADDTEK